jgi:hypothetical protein
MWTAHWHQLHLHTVDIDGLVALHTFAIDHGCTDDHLFIK